MRHLKTLPVLSKSNIRVIIIEFLSIFIAVFLAFWLNTWSQERNEHQAKDHIIKQLHLTIKKEMITLNYNKNEHLKGKNACAYFRDLVNNKPVCQDSVSEKYNQLFSDFDFTADKSAYQGILSKGLDIIKNDTLRDDISYFYNFYFDIVSKMEENTEKFQIFRNYFFRINNVLKKNMIFDQSGNLIEIKQPIHLSYEEKQELFSYLWMIEKSRDERIEIYDATIFYFEKLKQQIKAIIDKEID